MVRFSLISWNISHGQPSAQAPDWWDSEHNINAILDEVERYQPDFICLQEMPHPRFTELILDQFLPANPAESHSGYTTVFIRRANIGGAETELDSQFQLAGGAGIRLLMDGRPLMIFSLHLPPFKDSAALRQRYLNDLVQQLPAEPLVLAGDMNMREAETAFVTDDLQLTDAYKQIYPGRGPYATWDSTKNHYSAESYPFRARFDRVFTRDLVPISYQLIGDDVQSSENHFLSDHFGIYVELDLD